MAPAIKPAPGKAWFALSVVTVFLSTRRNSFNNVVEKLRLLQGFSHGSVAAEFLAVTFDSSVFRIGSVTCDLARTND